MACTTIWSGICWSSNPCKAVYHHPIVRYNDGFCVRLITTFFPSAARLTPPSACNVFVKRRSSHLLLHAILERLKLSLTNALLHAWSLVAKLGSRDALGVCLPLRSAL